jgi:hypothetical protein
MIPTTIEYEPDIVARSFSPDRIGGMRQQRWTVAYPRPFGTPATTRTRGAVRRVAFLALLLAASVLLHALALTIAELAYAPYRQPAAQIAARTP